VAPILLLMGVGLTVGSTVGGKLGDHRLIASLLAIIVSSAVALLLLRELISFKVPTLATLFIWGTVAFALVPLLQTAVVRYASEAPNLASTLNQGAFNLGNAVGAWTGSSLLREGLALRDLPWASIGFTAAAFGLAWWSYSLGKRRVDTRKRPEIAEVSG
jgi:MFS transporter, DHA1 family, inner membrane transport protein